MEIIFQKIFTGVKLNADMILWDLIFIRIPANYAQLHHKHLLENPESLNPF